MTRTVGKANDPFFLVNILPSFIEVLELVDTEHKLDNAYLYDSKILALLQHLSFPQLKCVWLCRVKPFSHKITRASWQSSEESVADLDKPHWHILERL